MPNGVAVRIASEPPGTPLDSMIGEAVASAATMLCQAMLEFQRDGQLNPETKAAGGDRIAELFTLQQATPGGINFAAVMHQEGKRVLCQRYGTDFRQQRGVDLDEAVIDGIISNLLEILAGVTAIERQLAH